MSCVCMGIIWAAVAAWGQKACLDVCSTKGGRCDDGAPEHGPRDVYGLPDPVGVSRRARVLQQMGGLSGHVAYLALHGIPR